MANPAVFPLDLNAPLQRITLKEQVRDRIRSLIRSGMLKSGEAVTEAGLAGLLGVSRTPVREAIVELTSEGLFENLTFGGARVHEVTEVEQEEIFLLRQTLEVLAVRRLCLSIAPAELRYLESIIDQQAQLTQDEHRERFLDLDQQFHLALARYAGLVLTQRILRILRDMFYLMGLAAVATKGRGEAVVAEHRAILQAISTGRDEEACSAICHHLTETQRSIRVLHLP